MLEFFDREKLSSITFNLPDRLFSLVATHKVEFGKVAVYVIADYVTAVQRVTLLPALKVNSILCKAL